MKLWFVRHAEAVDGNTFHGSDLERPLTPAGRRSAGKAFERLAASRRGPELIIASQAVRAWETARILGLAYGVHDITRTAALNPGCSLKDIRRVIRSLTATMEIVALVGHEPDFSAAVSGLVAGGALDLVLKKGSVAEVELLPDGAARLCMVVPPDLLG